VSAPTLEQATKALREVYGQRVLDDEPYLPDLLVRNGVETVTLDRDTQRRLSVALLRA
jgi:hypothetical protein